MGAKPEAITDIFIWQNLSKIVYYFKWVQFIIYQVYLNKVNKLGILIDSFTKGISVSVQSTEIFPDFSNSRRFD